MLERFAPRWGEPQRRGSGRYRWVHAALVLSLLVSAAMAGRRTRTRGSDAGDAPRSMQIINTPDYTIHSDLPEPQLDEVLHRLEKLAAEYRNRTDSLSDLKDNRRLPLFLYSNRDDYLEEGGRSDSAGFFDGERLLAYIGVQPDARAWHVIQHEAFHQYLIGKLGSEMPVWLNEGLAEYFGESMFTGDGFVSGIVPPWRLKRVQDTIKEGGFRSIRELTDMSHSRWNAQLRQENYDMAWSVIQFLAHGDDGKYQDGLLQYIKQAKGERLAARAFGEIFGDAGQMEERWRAYWLEYPEADSIRTSGIVAAQTVCSYLARTGIMQQNIRGIAQLESMARQGELRQPKSDTLPESLLLEYLDWAKRLGVWELTPGPKADAHVVLTLEGGTKIKSRYTLRNGRVDTVEAWVDEPQARPQRNGRPR